MTNITKIYGGPGTGKTTTLQKRLDDELKEYGIGDICFTTFSRKAKEVIFKRVRKAYPSIRKLEWFGTMHSICARLIGFNSENALTPEDKVEFCNKYHYEYEKVDLKNID